MVFFLKKKKSKKTKNDVAKAKQRILVVCFMHSLPL
jgi:hypothetical protein